MSAVKIYLTTLLLVLLKILANSQKLNSPCPRLFTYTGQNNQTGGWYGTITLLSDIDLFDVRLQLTFDRPALQLENSFGETETSDGKEYFIRKPDFRIKSNVPHRFSFFLKYNLSKPAPNLTSFKLNDKLVCPENELVSRYKDELDTNSPSDDICGTVVSLPLGLNAHHQTIQEGEFPWHTALYHTKGINLAYLCQASLISKYHVIAAAHCVVKRRSQTPLNPANLVAYLGKVYLKSFSNVGIQDRQVSQIISHPHYNAQTYNNDIALVKLTSAVHFTDYVRPVCLWQESSDLSSVFNKEGSVVGWGFDEAARITGQLIPTKMVVVSQETCVQSMPSFYTQFAPSNAYCTRVRNGTSLCSGDSGGGMVFPKRNSDLSNPIWQLRGVVSISRALQEKLKCDAFHYVMFTDVAQYLDWIKKSIQECIN